MPLAIIPGLRPTHIILSRDSKKKGANRGQLHKRPQQSLPSHPRNWSLRFQAPGACKILNAHVKWTSATKGRAQAMHEVSGVTHTNSRLLSTNQHRKKVKATSQQNMNVEDSPAIIFFARVTPTSLSRFKVSHRQKSRPTCAHAHGIKHYWYRAMLLGLHTMRKLLASVLAFISPEHCPVSTSSGDHLNFQGRKRLYQPARAAKLADVDRAGHNKLLLLADAQGQRLNFVSYELLLGWR